MSGQSVGAVFLSYASQDAEAARRISEALRDAGVEVWLDQNELVGGDVWDGEIRRRIKECALFVPLISANTERRLEGYFRLEWRLADQRTQLMAQGKPFLVPVVTDDTAEDGARVPNSFIDVQWTRVTGSAGASQFARHVSGLLNPAPLAVAKPPLNNARPDPRSMAVLAFANMSRDPENEYFSDGISEELLNILAKIPGMRVTARTSSFFFKNKNVPVPEIARQLGVAYVIEGSVRKSGHRVRIAVQLINAADGFQIWSDTFDRELQDIFSVQDEIAGLVARSLQLELKAKSAALRPVDPEVYRLCLAGRQLAIGAADESLRAAESSFNRAIEIDPDTAAAWAGLAYVWHMRARMRHVAAAFAPTELASAEQCARRALAVDPTMGEAEIMLGSLALLRGDLAAAEQALDRGLALSPNSETGLDILGFFQLRSGRPDLALDAAKKAHALNPFAWAPIDLCGLALWSLGRLDEAAAEFARAQPMAAPPIVRANRANVLAQLGRFDEAVAEARLALCAEARRGWQDSFNTVCDGSVALALAVAGVRDGAEELVEHILAGPSDRHYNAGYALIRLGRIDEGIALLHDMPQFVVFYLLTLLHGDPALESDRRWTELLLHLNANQASATRRRALASGRGNEVRAQNLE